MRKIFVNYVQSTGSFGQALLLEEGDVIRHQGTPHEGMTPHSGRYTWGSGRDPYQHPKDFVQSVKRSREKYRATDEDIAKVYGFSDVDSFRRSFTYRDQLANHPENFCKVVDQLRKEGKTAEEIGKTVGCKPDRLDDHYKYSKVVWEKIEPGQFENASTIRSDFTDQIKELKQKGYTDAQIALGLGLDRNYKTGTATLNAYRSISSNNGTIQILQENQKLMQEHPDWSRTRRAKELGLANESTLRSMENGSRDTKSKEIFDLADQLKKEMVSEKDKPYTLVGKGTAQRLQVNDSRLETALEVLKLEGYEVLKAQTPQMSGPSGQKTTLMCLCPPGTDYSDLKKALYNDADQLHVVGHYVDNETGDFHSYKEKPVEIDPKRVYIRYAEEGGKDRDGLIQLRRGVADISLADAAYAQVRIAVKDTGYLKGMAIHSDDIPEGYDIVFNTNKSNKKSMKEVLKPLKEDEDNPSNPFGASIITEDSQLKYARRHYDDPVTGERKLSALNIVNEEGNWNEWSETLSSQVLAKEKPEVARRQLKLTYEDREKEFNEINSLTNSVLRQQLLNEFAENTDHAAVTLKARPFKDQHTKVLLPYPELKENEIYAPGYKDGDKVALIRFPHAGTFETAVCVVNNKFAKAKKEIGDARDAVGIHPKTAGVLSGADFDGDTARVIPIGDKYDTKLMTYDDLSDQVKKEVQTLREFDPGVYELPSDTSEKSPKIMTKKRSYDEMGRITNLMVDMQDQGASVADVVKADMYSMVVIDAPKHKYDWKQARKDLGIDELFIKYHGGVNKGATTVMTRAKSPIKVDYRIEKTSTKNMTPEEKEAWERGEKIWNYPDKFEPDRREIKEYNPETGKKEKTGRWETVGYKKKQIESTKMAEVKDARDLISKEFPSEMQEIYADYANSLKALANKARAEARKVDSYLADKEAKVKYADAVTSLKEKIRNAEAHKPLEQKAQALARSILRQKKEAHPDWTDEDYKKQKKNVIKVARARMGMKKDPVEVTPYEWEAIQAHAVSKETLKKVLTYADADKIKQYAMPRETKKMSLADINRAISMLESGRPEFTRQYVADYLQVSLSTLEKNIDMSTIKHSDVAYRWNE